MNLKVPTKIEVRNSEIHGMGIFATEHIEKDEIIEECHLITLNINECPDTKLRHGTHALKRLADYVFFWPPGVNWPQLVAEMKRKERDKVVIEWKLENGEILKAIHPDETRVLPLGYGCIYNHAENNNAAWKHHPNYKAFQYLAIKDIEAGQEICTNYGLGRWEW